MKLPTDKITQRLPGHKTSRIGRVANSLPTDALKNVPGKRTVGTAAGVIVGAGAAVAATKAATRLNGRHKDSDEQTESAKPKAQEQTDQSEQNEDGKKGLFGRGKGGAGGGKKPKVVNIVEEIDIGAPRRLVYDQWTRFQDFPSFTKKVVGVDQTDDEKLQWKAKIFWSTRTWESTIIEQLPDKRIVWRSKGAKGHVDGAVTFHRIAPNLTRVLLVLEYHPQGLFERIGNLWRAQGRRARLELKHFRRHVMTQSLTNPEGVEGWRGEIRDSEVVKSHEDAVAEEEKAEKESGEDRYEETFTRSNKKKKEPATRSR
ncbi:SRPBCC family protein [Actinomadura rupiterrae]|uniref:SRPBCC family protein n=1 Tax=Actinomadura rupiterrae TaxID=559627 RepID=UPI0020A594F6|nr:SRPBCC family protein [Actinomadura rupiterrae]MCP2334808.1 putative membrane protein [Actinomadura rupiterrae]